MDETMSGDTLRAFAIRETVAKFGVSEDIAARVVDAALARTGLPPDLEEPADGRVIPLTRGHGDLP
jgi:hypothetical protein